MLEVELIPIPPDTVASVKQDIIARADAMGLSSYQVEGIAWGDTVRVHFQDTPESWDFLREMKKICVVKVIV
jgi:hypothetical protein